jgi:hypothetical protein
VTRWGSGAYPLIILGIDCGHIQCDAYGRSRRGAGINRLRVQWWYGCVVQACNEPRMTQRQGAREPIGPRGGRGRPPQKPTSRFHFAIERPRVPSDREQKIPKNQNSLAYKQGYKAVPAYPYHQNARNLLILPCLMIRARAPTRSITYPAFRREVAASHRTRAARCSQR